MRPQIEIRNFITISAGTFRIFNTLSTASDQHTLNFGRPTFYKNRCHNNMSDQFIDTNTYTYKVTMSRRRARERAVQFWLDL